MSKTLLIAGQDYPLTTKYIDAALLTERSVFATVSEEMSKKEENTIVDENSIQVVPAGAEILNWNRSSPISARSIIIKAEASYERLDEALLIFDSPSFGAKFKDYSPSVLSRAMDEMVLGYNLLISETLERYAVKGGGALVFLLNYAPSQVDMVRGLARKSPYEVPLPLPVAIAQQSFVAMAESIALRYSGANDISVLLVRNEAEREESIPSWLFQYMDDTLKEHALSGKNSVNWIKPGSKYSSGFSLFHR